MTSLLIDTCTEHGVVAFFSDGEILHQGDIPVGHHNSKFMMAEIDKGFKALKLTPSDLKYIAIAVGPGSYTGIRIGVVAAKTLAYASRLPLVPFSSLEGFVPDQDGPFIAMIDAKISGAYIMKGIKEGDEMRWSSEPSVLPLLDFEKELGTSPRIITPNARSLRSRLEKQCPNFKASWIETPPNVKHLVSHANTLYSKGKFHSDGEIEILYLRKTQAEIEREGVNS